ncbi:restriction endonuclease subunit S [Enterococcus hirae]
MSNDTQPEIRFPGFTEAWEERKLGELGKTQSGIGFPDAEQGGSEGIPFFKVSDMNNIGNEYEMRNANHYVSNEQIERKKWKPIEDVPAIIFAKVGAAIMLNRKRLVTSPFLIDNNTMAYLFNNTWDIYFGKILFETINLPRYSQVGALPSYNSSDIENISVKVPVKDEQQKIGNFFKQLDDTIALHQRKLDLLKETKKGFLQKMFPKNGAKVPEIRFPGFTEDWEERRLNDFISGDISDGDWIEKEHIKDEGKYRIIQTGNIGNGVYIDKEKSAKYMDQNSFDILKANEIFPGDLLVSRLAEPAGRTVILPNIEDRMVTAVDVTILRQNENFDAYFLLSQMNTSKILNKVSKNVSGTSHKRISRKNLEKVTIDSTSIEEQNKIGAFFKQLDDTIALHQRKLDLLKETKKGFLQKMFV